MMTRLVKLRTILVFGAPGSGKGTQGKILGTIPGFYHCACGDVFRSLDLRTPLGQAFLEYSSKGQLVPDDLTVSLWTQQISNQQTMGRFKPEIDRLVLDGIPRNVEQAKMMEDHLNVEKVFYLHCKDRAKLVERLKRRALKDNRLDDANEAVIEKRLQVYADETRPVVNYYGPDKVVELDATQWPYQVLREILQHL